MIYKTETQDKFLCFVFEKYTTRKNKWVGCEYFNITFWVIQIPFRRKGKQREYQLQKAVHLNSN